MTEETANCPDPKCNWTMTGLPEEVLHCFRAHNLLEHGIKPIKWEKRDDGTWEGGRSWK